MLDSTAVWMQFDSEIEAEEFLLSLRGEEDSPFRAVERWMEILGRPPGGVWLQFIGVPLQVWREGVFKLLGDCVGQTLEVDRRTIQQEDLLFGRVKVLRDEIRSLHKEILLCLDDIQVPVKVEEGPIDFQQKGESVHGWEKMVGVQARSFLGSDDGGEDEDETIGESCSESVAEMEVEDADVSSSNLKFKLNHDTRYLDDVATHRREFWLLQSPLLKGLGL